MKDATIKLTTDQKKELCEKFGLLYDELVLSFIPKGCVIKAEDLDSPVLLVMGHTYTVS